MITLKRFQTTDVDSVVSKALAVLAEDTGAGDAHTLLLTSPTGSGKTVMALSAMERIAGAEGASVAFIWLAPLTLHQQSLERLNSLGTGALLGFDLTATRRKRLDANDVAFCNWDSVNKTVRKPTDEDPDGIKALSALLRPREDGTDLPAMCAATRADGCKLVLVIDERTPMG